MAKTDILSLNINELSELLTRVAFPEKPKAYWGSEIFSWLHKKHAASFNDMTNLPRALKEKLGEAASIKGAEIIRTLTSEDGSAVKYLLKLRNNTIIEAVYLSYQDYGGATACISSQAGCRMGCRFCASAGGFDRHLTPGEMLSQVYEIKKSTGKLNGVVIMGVGEPLDNFGNTVRFIELLSAPEGQNIGRRGITVSTCGIVPKIYELAEAAPQVTLAISLHAPDDVLRKQLMPGAAKYSLSELTEAGNFYARKTKRRVTYEYALIRGVNDHISHAKALSAIIKGQNCHVNLIPLNSYEKRQYVGSSPKQVQNFAAELEKSGINTTVRRSIGGDIAAACGQLRKTVDMDLDESE